LAAVVCLGLLAEACTDDGKKSGDLPPGPYPYDTYLAAIRDVDLLFVIDNSGSTLELQEMLRQQFTVMPHALADTAVGLPNLHIGVTSTNLGAGPYGITFCEGGGDGGRLLTGNCPNPVGVPYIVDVAPQGCEATRDATGGCSLHGCEASNCGHEPTTTLVLDSTTGCPRCRNYAGQDLEEVFSCIASLGTQGCGFEQPLEAMYKALDSETAHNRGFLRESALLAVVFIGDEDDCSSSTQELFDPSDTAVESLGPLTSFRCFEYGVTCDQPSRDLGIHTGCLPREDEQALLHPVSRYITFLSSLKDPLMLVVSAIAGPTMNGEVMVGWDEFDWLEVKVSCQGDWGTEGVPGLRLRALVEAFNPAEDMDWAFSSVCAPTYVTALEGIGQRIHQSLVAQCLPSPLQGCADPGAEHGIPGDAYAGNDQCLASCQVTDIFWRGTMQETRAEVPPCLQVCPSGPCPGNTDRTLAYAAGHPGARDPDLPVSACWHVGYSEICERANHAELVISRREAPPPRSFASTSCTLILQHELRCADGEDNDEDGLVDLEDPDCESAAE
jgi:hypothetical protein